MKKKTTTQTIQQSTDKKNGVASTLEASPLDLKILTALRAEIGELSKELAENGPTLSSELLRRCSKRLNEVASFAEAFSEHGVDANGVAIVEGAGVASEPAVVPVKPVDDKRAKRDALVLELRGKGVTWAKICERTKLSISQARDAFTRAQRAAALVAPSVTT